MASGIVSSIASISVGDVVIGVVNVCRLPPGGVHVLQLVVCEIFHTVAVLLKILPKALWLLLPPATAL